MSHVTDRTFGAVTSDPEVAARLREGAARHWKLLLAIGILSILVGLYSIFVPIVATISVTILVGWALVIGGGVQLLHAFRGGGWEIALNLVLAVVTVAAGIVILLAPLTGTITLTVVLVAWFWFSGAMRLAAWWRLRGVHGSWVVLLNGLLNVLLGILIWADLPNSATWAIGLLVGISLLFTGIDLLQMAFAGRALAKV